MSVVGIKNWFRSIQNLQKKSSLSLWYLEMPGALICSLFERKEILDGMILNSLLYKEILFVVKFWWQKSFICQDFVRKAELFEICYSWEQV